MIPVNMNDGGRVSNVKDYAGDSKVQDLCQIVYDPEVASYAADKGMKYRYAYILLSQDRD